MQPFPTPGMSGTDLPGAGALSEPSSWRVLDEVVDLTFPDPPPGTPHTLRWRGSSWRILGSGRRWSTWRALPVEQEHADGTPSTRGLRTDFWRFAAQTNPVAPVFHFEARRSGSRWHLVRIGVAFDLPPLS